MILLNWRHSIVFGGYQIAAPATEGYRELGESTGEASYTTQQPCQKDMVDYRSFRDGRSFRGVADNWGGERNSLGQQFTSLQRRIYQHVFPYYHGSVREKQDMRGYIEIGVAIEGCLRACCLCSTFKLVFTRGLVLDVSDRTNKVLVVEVTFLFLPTKCLILRQFSHSTMHCCATLIPHFDTDVYSQVANGIPVDTLSNCTIR